MPWVYIAQADDGAVKIGRTALDPSVRAESFPVIDLAANIVAARFFSESTSAAEVEATLLRAFKPWRLAGEWFHPCAAILSLVEAWGGSARADRVGSVQVADIEPISIPAVDGDSVRERLAEWMRLAGLNQCDLARRLGCAQATVSDILSKRRCPGIGLAVDLETLTDGAIAVRDWVPLARQRRGRHAEAA